MQSLQKSQSVEASTIEAAEFLSFFDTSHESLPVILEHNALFCFSSHLALQFLKSRPPAQCVCVQLLRNEEVFTASEQILSMPKAHDEPGGLWTTDSTFLKVVCCRDRHGEGIWGPNRSLCPCAWCHFNAGGCDWQNTASRAVLQHGVPITAHSPVFVCKADASPEGNKPLSNSFVLL